MMLTGEQIRAGRALARLEQAELAHRSGLSLETIKRLERIRGPVGANVRTVHALQDAFSAVGVSVGWERDGKMFVCLGATA
jgi:transcriptional regulator with XRE-family HTH domain